MKNSYVTISPTAPPKPQQAPPTADPNAPLHPALRAFYDDCRSLAQLARERRAEALNRAALNKENLCTQQNPAVTKP